MDSLLAAARRKRGMWVSDLRDLIIGELPKFDIVIHDVTQMLEKGQ
jgi:hypothetical protein